MNAMCSFRLLQLLRTANIFCGRPFFLVFSLSVHEYATLRLQEGVDVYFLAEQMGTSVHMIEEHYGHVNTIKHADRVLQGMAGWEVPHPEPDVTRAEASKAAETHDKSKRGQHRRTG
jgi:integrase